jgi:hypothetical protein
MVISTFRVSSLSGEMESRSSGKSNVRELADFQCTFDFRFPRQEWVIAGIHFDGIPH